MPKKNYTKQVSFYWLWLRVIEFFVNHIRYQKKTWSQLLTFICRYLQKM